MIKLWLIEHHQSAPLLSKELEKISARMGSLEKIGREERNIVTTHGGLRKEVRSDKLKAWKREANTNSSPKRNSSRSSWISSKCS